MYKAESHPCRVGVVKARYLLAEMELAILNHKVLPLTLFKGNGPVFSTIHEIMLAKNLTTSIKLSYSS